MITTCVSDAEFPEASVAVHVTMVSPNGKNSGASLVMESISEISSTSNSPKSSTLVLIPVASISIFSGIIKTGSMVSTTFTFCI